MVREQHARWAEAELVVTAGPSSRTTSVVLVYATAQHNYEVG
jgi:hypothetical protein